jgi:hypothetical protein
MAHYLPIPLADPVIRATLSFKDILFSGENERELN